MSRYVNDKRTPDIDFIKKVVNALNVSADFLLGFTEDMTVQRDVYKRQICEICAAAMCIDMCCRC